MSRLGGEHRQEAPSISLPKGGGAIRGMGEKFAANPVTGTGSLSVPIATSPGRSAFGPQLSLSYDSGGGNGQFGLGWALSLPAVTRKTDKGLPRYRDADESDVFILSGAEDLVPVLADQGAGKWERQTPVRTVGGKRYRVQRYRPRIEGLLARIERWSNEADPEETFWRSISRDNITTWYGRTENSRIVDPDNGTRIFSWLICESHDDRGNVIVYGYKPEDSRGVDPSRAHERNRALGTRKANRYLKRIRYGNREPYLPALSDTEPWPAPPGATGSDASAHWLFEVVLDYGEHDPDVPTPEESAREWTARNDPFSSYRAGFEVRTYRLCQRVLMFHHFPNEPAVGANCLVRSTDFTYSYEEDPASAQNPVFSYLLAVSQSGYKRRQHGYLRKPLPPLEFEYSQVPGPGQLARRPIRELDAGSLQNLPVGLDGTLYRWTDLDGEGASGILTEQGGGWYYKRNLSADNPIEDPGQPRRTVARFGASELVARRPDIDLAGGGRFLDLAGDGQADVVQMEGPARGFFERTDDADWAPFRAFVSWPGIDTRGPDLRFVDLSGDGHADILVTEGETLTWYPSLGEKGFGPAVRVDLPQDEEKGPRLVFADGARSVHLADLAGDGLSDLVRIRNGEVCYWPNLGYGRFGAKVTMDHAPWFDSPDQFDPGRIRLADTDGSGTTDILYLRRDGARLYFNQSGNGWSDGVALPQFPPTDDLSSVEAVDLLGTGTTCLAWSSPLPDAARRPMCYIALMDEKPHLLTREKNNLGAETRVRYAPSTRFYLQDRRDGRPWLTRLPFPVHVVERAETYDHLSRNRFVTCYAYHHGYFDGVEREFRGFGMVEQTDTEEIGSLGSVTATAGDTNWDAASYVPPVLTRTWFHTGVFLHGRAVSQHLAREYYGAPPPGDPHYKEHFRAFVATQLLDDTVLPDGLTTSEQREACRALKGSMLRQEVYALDGTAEAEHPYTVAEQNLTIERVQPREGQRHAVFFTHPREAITWHYERNPADPRVQHALTLEVDPYGNVLKSVSAGYPRRPGQSPLQGDDRQVQERTLITYAENKVTNPVDDPTSYPDAYRTPLPREARTYEVTGLTPTGGAARFGFAELSASDFNAILALPEVAYEQPAGHGEKGRRLIEDVRTVYRRDDLTALLPPGDLEPQAVPGETYKLAFTPGLAAATYRQRVSDQMLTDEGRYAHSEGDASWWIPSGRAFYSPSASDPPAAELAFARAHFFLPHRYRDPFGNETAVAYDGHSLLPVETTDALGNVVTVRTRDDAGKTEVKNDYRVLQPYWITDPNGNRARVAFDALGMVAGTAVMGKPGANEGDDLTGFEADLAQSDIDALHDAGDPHAPATSLLRNASTRVVYDLDRFRRSQQAHPEDAARWEAPYAATLARETHAGDPALHGLKIQISFDYSDGFGREIQKKVQAEPGPAPKRDANGTIVLSGGGQPEMTASGVSPRWVGNGWTVFNDKGKPVRQYEPFFTDTHRFEFAVRVGVSPVLFYDPAGRVVATLHPDHTYEKLVFDPWQQTTYDANDTVTLDPAGDDDVKAFFLDLTDPNHPPRLPRQDYEPSWYALRTNPAHAPDAAARWPDPRDLTAAKAAAAKAAVHANTPTVAHFDTLGRTFLTTAHNRAKYSNSAQAAPPVEEQYPTRTVTDIEGNTREFHDALGRTVMRYDYDMLGNRIHQASMEAGERWTLHDAAGRPLYAWDSRGHRFKTEYDRLHRPLRHFVRGTDPARCDTRTLNRDVVFARIEYGEGRPDDAALNLRTRAARSYDEAGVVTNERYDFKGNLLSGSRTLADDYRKLYDWAVDTVQQSWHTYPSSTTYDALNRPVTVTSADGSIYRPAFNEANLLEKVQVNLPGAKTSTAFVTSIDYDAKGQRTLIEYGNGVKTKYEYDPLTFRLLHLLTRRDPASFPGDCPQPPPSGWPGCQIQNLHYAYDPAGNITRIRDDAQQAIYFRNKRVEPAADYTYDAVYRLIEATGREHLGQNGAPVPSSYNDAPRAGLPQPGDGNAMGTYLERYLYDGVGNFSKMQHVGTSPANAGWTRSYTYGESSPLLESGQHSNRLSSTTVGSTNPITGNYGYDAHGNMLGMPHLRIMQWDFKDQLQMTQRQVVNTDDTDGAQHKGERTYYVYDSAGQRVRKVTESATGQVKDERIYLGGFEIYRKNGINPLVRETLHVMDDKQRIALVETRTQDSGPAPPQLIRYQLTNHLGSVTLELDRQALIISYEEYTPYGSTSYQAVRSQTETPKRYRYTGKERDEETGFSYHRARYYAPWLGRWTSSDPLDILDGVNLYRYAHCNPVGLKDLSGFQSKYAGCTLAANREGDTGLPVICPSSPEKSIGASLTGPLPPMPGGAVKITSAHAKHHSAPHPNPEKQKSRELSPSELTELVEGMAPRLVYPKIVRQISGAVGFIGGTTEAVIGGVGGLLSAETVVGSAEGTFLLLHGIDTARSNLLEAITGERVHTFSYRMSSWATYKLTNDRLLSRAVGSAMDTTLSIAHQGLSLTSLYRPLSLSDSFGQASLDEALTLGFKPQSEDATFHFNAGWGDLGANYSDIVSEYASQRQLGITIGDTPGGRFANIVGLKDWKPPSAEFATEAGLAGRPVNVTLGNVPGPGSVWVQTEEPILKFFGVPVQYHLRVVQELPK